MICAQDSEQHIVDISRYIALHGANRYENICYPGRYAPPYFNYSINSFQAAFIFAQRKLWIQENM